MRHLALLSLSFLACAPMPSERSPDGDPAPALEPFEAPDDAATAAEEELPPAETSADAETPPETAAEPETPTEEGPEPDPEEAARRPLDDALFLGGAVACHGDVRDEVPIDVWGYDATMVPGALRVEVAVAVDGELFEVHALERVANDGITEAWRATRDTGPDGGTALACAPEPRAVLFAYDNGDALVSCAVVGAGAEHVDVGPIDVSDCPRR